MGVIRALSIPVVLLTLSAGLGVELGPCRRLTERRDTRNGVGSTGRRGDRAGRALEGAATCAVRATGRYRTAVRGLGIDAPARAP